MDGLDAIELDLGGLHRAIRSQRDAWRFSRSGAAASMKQTVFASR
jgi:hypothetical protein